MTKILILGGGGMVGQKLANHLLASGLPGHKALDITLFDMAFPLKQDGRLRCITGSLTDAQNITMLARLRPDIVFHLMFTMWHYLEALKALHIESNRAYLPKIIFTSSIAVFGGPFPEQIDDTFLSAPQTSYGAQKASCELLLSDFSRKGFVDGISLRLPTICVRPGKANLAASSFFSGIIREPLNGQKAILPVDESVRHWHASPRSAAGFLRHAATLDSGLLENRRALNLPGVSCTVEDQIEALRRAAGQSVIKLIERQPDDTIINIVSSWPRNFTAKRARALGFQAEASFDEIIATYIQDDLPNASKASAD